jgi:hypothetical protein
MFIVHIVSPVTDVVTIAEIDDISLLFFDTFIASISAHLIQESLSIDQLTYFECKQMSYFYIHLFNR